MRVTTKDQKSEILKEQTTADQMELPREKKLDIRLGHLMERYLVALMATQMVVLWVK